jgi:hypothetical protein
MYGAGTIPEILGLTDTPCRIFSWSEDIFGMKVRLISEVPRPAQVIFRSYLLKSCSVLDFGILKFTTLPHRPPCRKPRVPVPSDEIHRFPASRYRQAKVPSRPASSALRDRHQHGELGPRRLRPGPFLSRSHICIKGSLSFRRGLGETMNIQSLRLEYVPTTQRGSYKPNQLSKGVVVKDAEYIARLPCEQYVLLDPISCRQ